MVGQVTVAETEIAASPGEVWKRTGLQPKIRLACLIPNLQPNRLFVGGVGGDAVHCNRFTGNWNLRFPRGKGSFKRTHDNRRTSAFEGEVLPGEA